MRGVLNGALAALTLGLLVGGCATKSDMYNWGEYDTSLYKYYKNDENRTEYHETLVEIVRTATPEKPVPPGVYAELGYIELEAGNREEAIRLFTLERRAWPESAALMDRTIASLQAAGEDAPAAEKVSDQSDSGS